MIDLARFEIYDLSTPAAFGMEWKHPETKATFQLVFPIHGKVIRLGYRKAGGKLWSMMPVIDPERFGPHPHTARQALEFTKAFIESSEK